MDDLKVCTKCKTAKERSEFSRDASKKDGLQFRCKPCKKAYRTANSDSLKAYRRAYYKEHIEEETARSKAWDEAYPDKKAAIGGKTRAIQRGGSLSEIYDIDLCVPFYAEARRLSNETGIMHHVDHIVPLSKGGLHCQTNLQVLTARENIQKGDSHVCQT